jgi:peptidoglycan/LPS O-acetylase OafA/YrhL
VRGLGSLLIALGLLLLGLAALCLWEGSRWMKLAAYVATLLGLLPLSWGLLLRWHRQAWSGFVAAALALVSGVMVAPGILDPGVAAICMVLEGLSLATVAGGVALGSRRLGQSTDKRGG